MTYLEAVATIAAALGPVATGVLGVALKRSDARKTQKLDEVVDQVKANGGSTMRDAIDRIEHTLRGLAARIETLETERANRRTTRWWP